MNLVFDIIAPDMHGGSVLYGAVFEFQHSAGAYCRTDAATDTGRAHDVLTSLGIPTYIYSHFAVGGTITARYALSTVDGDAKSGEKAV